MSQRGRGSGPHDDDPDGEEARRDRASGGSPLPSSTGRPIVPYDPYRTSSGESSRRSTRNVASDQFDSPLRGVSRRGGESPFLPDDDPLSAEAWQLELDEAEVGGDEDFAAARPDIEREPPPPRRPRRQPAATRSGRAAESGAGARRAPRRRSADVASARERSARPAVTIGMPQVVAGSSLVADQTAMVLLAVNVVSLLVMALLLGVRLGGVPSPTVLHIDAAGNPDRWGPPSVLWRLPLMSFFITVMFTVVAWFLHPIDRFAARFALGAAAVAQVVAWVAVIQHVFVQ
jgi:hypothetical protein